MQKWWIKKTKLGQAKDSFFWFVKVVIQQLKNIFVFFFPVSWRQRLNISWLVSFGYVDFDKTPPEKTPPTSFLTKKYSEEVIKNLSCFFKEKDFTELFETLAVFIECVGSLPYWSHLREDDWEEERYGEEIRKLLNVFYEIRKEQPLRRNKTTVREQLEKNLKSYYINLIIDRCYSFRAFATKFSTEKQKEKAFIDSFTELFVFRFFQEKWKEEELFSEENRNVLLSNNNLIFSFLSSRSQALVWEKLAMNIFVLFTPISQKLFLEIYCLFFSDFFFGKDESFSVLIKAVILSLCTEEEQKEKENYWKELEKKNIFENAVQSYNYTFYEKCEKKYHVYEDKLKKTIIIEDFLREKAELEKNFEIILSDLFLSYLLSDLAIKYKTIDVGFSVDDYEDCEDILVHYSMLFCLLLTEEKKRDIWVRVFISENIVLLNL